MATDYISRSEFDGTMQERYCFNCERKGNHPIFGVACKACWVRDMLDEVEQFQSADVRPVVHATWRDDADKIDKRFNKHDYFCPVCNTRADAFVAGSEDWYCYFAPNFCPNCGADMRKVVEIDQVKEADT